MKTILVPVDFSDASRHAADYAAMLAKQTGAGIFLLHVFTEPLPVTEAGLPMASGIVVDLHSELRLQVRKEIRRLRKNTSVVVKGEAMPGLKGEKIREMAEELDADLICLGRKQRTHKPLFGSTILKAVRKTDVPVLVIPEETKTSPMKRVVLAVDFKEMLHDSYLKPLFELIRAFSASLKVLHIEKSGTSVLPFELPEKLQAVFVLSMANYEYEKLESDNVEKGILEFLQRHPTDLFVLIAHHHSLADRLFGEVHTPHLAFAVSTPLLILKHQP